MLIDYSCRSESFFTDFSTFAAYRHAFISRGTKPNDTNRRNSDRRSSFGGGCPKGENYEGSQNASWSFRDRQKRESANTQLTYAGKTEGRLKSIQTLISLSRQPTCAAFRTHRGRDRGRARWLTDVLLIAAK
jgi:hypothetical protein